MDSFHLLDIQKTNKKLEQGYVGAKEVSLSEQLIKQISELNAVGNYTYTDNAAIHPARAATTMATWAWAKLHNQILSYQENF